MAAAATDYFTEVGSPGTATTLAAPGHAIAGTSFTVVSTSNWPTNTGVVFAVDNYTLQTVNGVPNTAVRTPGTYTEWEGVVSSATSITGAVLRYGTDQNYSAGSLTRVYIPVASSRENRLAQGIQVQHNQDGTHGAVTATSATISGALAVTGATTLTGALTVKSWDGWITDTNTWVYVSASSFKVSGVDVSAAFPVGTKIKLSQSGSKYFYVTSATFSTDTTVNITAGSDYTLANAAITSPQYSYQATPQGFPQVFNYAPTWTALTTGNGTVVAKFSMIGKDVLANVYLLWGSTTSVSGSVIVTLPVTSAAVNGTVGDTIGTCKLYDGTNQFNGPFAHNTTTSGVVRWSQVQGTGIKDSNINATTPNTWTTGSEFHVTTQYKAA